MPHYKLLSSYQKLLSDTYTPVNIYLKLRDQFPNTFLLESSDYHGTANAYSYVCANPIASFKADRGVVTMHFPDGTTEVHQPDDPKEVIPHLNRFKDSFETEDLGFDFITNGLFGYISFDSVVYFDDYDVSPLEDNPNHVPEIMYQVFERIVVINHFNSELYIFEHPWEGNGYTRGAVIEDTYQLITGENLPTLKFSLQGEETSNFTDEAYRQALEHVMGHCFRGDNFQVVLSRAFEQGFQGDEFNVYRALRSINPSPYLFYFDYGDFRLMGSSPEAQLVIQNEPEGQKAKIYPIAGTIRRTGKMSRDQELAQDLLADEKENAEHVMLVDLARNDLSRNCRDVQVEVFKEIQYYSHVIHLVSRVTGKLKPDTSAMKALGESFPAGTLSGAPKIKAVELIDHYEQRKRSYYGGAIGFLGFNGELNHAIMIRSILSKNQKLYYQAGGGIVVKSKIEGEMQEVHNKLAALKKAIELAQTV